MPGDFCKIFLLLILFRDCDRDLLRIDIMPGPYWWTCSFLLIVFLILLLELSNGYFLDRVNFMNISFNRC